MPFPPYYLEVMLSGRMACAIAMKMYREGSLRCSLNLSQKVLQVSPMYSSSQVRSPHWNQYMVPLFFDHGVFVFGGDQ